MKCNAPGCTSEASAWPIVVMGRVDREGSYQLEIPMAICPMHQDGFQPERFISAEARQRFNGLAEAWDMPAPNYRWFVVEWKALNDPAFNELDGTEARFSPRISK